MNTPTDTEIDERRACTSASNAPADLLCPGRHMAQRGLPRPPRNPDAAFGDHVHSALAWRKQELIQALTIEEREAYDQIAAMEVKAVKDFFGPDADLSKMRFFPEQRIWIQFQAKSPDGTADIKLEHSAKPDKVFRLGNRLFIPEYKSLAGDIPESPRNVQLRDQAVLARGHYLGAEGVGVVVLQPMVTMNPEICFYTSADLDRARDELFNRVYASNLPNSPRVPGEVQCKFCLAKNTSRCPEYQKWAGAMAIGMANLLDVPVENWSPEQRRIFCDRYDAAAKWLNDTWDRLAAMAEKDPNFVPGYGLKEGNKREEITDPQRVFERFVQAGGSTEAFLRAIKVVKTRLKEELRNVCGANGASLIAKYMQLTEGCVEVKRNRSSLTRVD